VCALAASHIPLATAQTGFASISGRVADPSGAVIQKADVTLKNLDTGVVLATQTNNEGVYNLPSVKPGNYVMHVQKQGFRSVDVTGLTLYVQDQLARNFSLEAGSVSESITVSADQNNINMTDGSVSTVIEQDYVANIPLNGRSFQDLIALTPGVVTQSPQAGQGYGQSGVPSVGDFSVNGQRTESNNYIVDGVSGNTNPGSPGASAGNGGGLGASTVLGTTQSLLSIDALQEFRVESSTYSAEYGGSPGGQFSFISRSGASSLHGSLFEYLRNDVFDANDWFNDYLDAPKPPLKQNDFGGTVGGPVWIPKLYNGKDRTFFFFSYEGLRLIQPTAASEEYVPSTSLRASAASVLQPAMNAFPVPTAPEIQIACNNVNYICPAGQPVGTLVPSGMAPFTKSFSLPSNIDSSSLRFDQAIRSSTRVFLRAAYTPSTNSTRALSTVSSNRATAQSYTAGLDTQMSSTVSNQLRAGYSRAITGWNDALDNFGGATPTNLAQLLGICCSLGGQSEVETNFPGIGEAFLYSSRESGYQYQWNINNAVNWELGRHSFKAGIFYRRINSPYSLIDPAVTALYRNSSSIENNEGTLFVQRQRTASPLYNQVALFVQDEWKLTRSINLSLGVRWEVEPPPTSTNANKPYPLLGNPNDPSTYTLGTQGAPLYKTTWDNFAPRIGAAWKAHGTPGMETVVRGGVGIFYDTGTQSTSGAFAGIGNIAFGTYKNASVPATPAQVDLSLSATAPYSGANFVANNFKLPYTIEWNMALEQALGRGQSVSLTYVGSNGRRLVEENYFDGGPLNPDFSSLFVFQNGLTSNYQALQVQFRRQVRHGLQALGSYTWSHSLDFASTGDCFGYCYARGNSDFDVRSNFNAGLSWDLPLNQDNRVSRTLLNGWGVDGRIFAHTAFPVSLEGNFVTNPSTGAGTYAALDIVPGQPFYIYSSKLPGGREINANAFAATTGNEAGNAPRNFARGFGEQQVNLAVRREFPVAESLRLQFRAETFNILNHPNFGYIDPYLTDATFGQALATLTNSLSTVSPLYQQGGARSMQFALKLIF
jgi:hypothetical protein